MSDVQEQILDAVKILADNAVSASNATITIECKIIEVIDAGVGLYKVEYKANKFECYSSNPSIVYKINDTVYVIVPDGDFDKNKTIIGAVAPVASMYVETEKVDNYIPISENLIRDLGEMSLHSYREDKFIYPDEQGQPQPGVDNFNLLFSDYLKTYNTFLLSTKIKTNIELTQQVQGNYGLKLKLPFISNDKQVENYYKEIILDVSNIQGSPYRLTEFTLQNLYFEIPSDFQYDNTRTPILEIFSIGFPQQDESKPEDIWIKDISLKAVDVLTVENKEGYYLSLVSDKGNYFLTGDGPKVLSPVLKIKGKNTNIKNYDCYWFLEDASIDTTSDDYTTIGGLGWRCLNAKTNVTYTDEGKMTFQYVTNIYELQVSSEDVYGSSKYKCVLTRGNVIISGSLVLHNFQSDRKTDLISATGSNDFIKDTGFITLISKVWDSEYDSSFMQMKTAWQRFDKNGNFYTFTEGEDGFEILRLNELVEDHYETEIRFRSSLVEDLNLITCSVYRSDVVGDSIKEHIIGTNSLVVTTSANFVYRLAVQNGDILYKYDADGDSPMIADYDGPVSSRVSALKPISYKIFKADGLELSDTEYLYCETEWHIPVNSMIIPSDKTQLEEYGRYYIVTDKELHYTIASTYNIKKNDNTITLIVKMPDTEITQNIDIKFIKDGEGGTNGSKYTGLITFGSNSDRKTYGQRGFKLQFICVGKQTGNDDWYDHFIEEVTDIYGNVTEVEHFDKYSTKMPTGIPIGGPSGEYNYYFNVEVYKDGEMIPKEEGSTINYEIEWSVFDETVTTPFLNKSGNYFVLNTYKWGNEGNEKITYATIIQAKITIKDKEAPQAEEQVIYAYYPIEVSYIEKGGNINSPNFVYNFIGGFDKVLYASDGTNPQYDNVNDFSLSLNAEDEKYKRNYEWTSSKNFTLNEKSAYYKHKKSDGTEEEFEIANSYCSARPVSKYDSGESKNYIRVKMTGVNQDAPGYILLKEDLAKAQQRKSVVIDELAKLQKKQEETIITINQYLDDLYSYLDSSITTYNNNTKPASFIINNRFNGIGFLKQLLNAEDVLYNYCFTISGLDASNFNKNYLDSIKNDYTLQKNNFINLGNDEDDFQDLYWLKVNTPKDKIKSVENVLNNVIKSLNFKKKYPAIYTKLRGYVIDLVDRYTKYKVCYDNLISLVVDGTYIGYRSKEQQHEQQYFNIIHTLRNLYNVYSSDPNERKIRNQSLDNLINLDSGTFNQINNRLQILFNSFFTDQASSNFIDNNIISEAKKIKDTYKSGGFYQNYYEKEIIALTAEGKELDKKIDELTKTEDSFKEVIIHIKPILLLYNRYEMTNLNGWDGNKLYTGSDPNNSAFLLAPQIGAGKREENTFTGMVMGLRNLNKINIQTQIGLFGYNKGTQTLFLNSRDGSAIFGKSGNGQITLDPKSEKALIYSYNFWKNYSSEDGKPSSYRSSNENGAGMLIDLTTPEIRFGSGNFKVNSNGHLTAIGGGTIAGWQITNDQLKSKDNTVILDSTNGGSIYSSSHTTLDSPSNSGFYLSKDGLSIGSSIKISSANNGSIEIGRLSSNGKKWTINGDSTSAYIKYKTKGESGSVYIGTDEILLGQKLKLSPDGSIQGGTDENQKWWINTKGDAHFNKLYASKSGEIGGWTIEGAQLKGGNVVINSNGNITNGDSWGINNSGSAYFTNVKITGVQDGSTFGGMGYSKGVTYGAFAGNSTYSSTVTPSADGKTGPFEGTCKTHIDNLIVNNATITNLTSDVATIKNKFIFKDKEAGWEGCNVAQETNETKDYSFTAKVKNSSGQETGDTVDIKFSIPKMTSKHITYIGFLGNAE